MRANLRQAGAVVNLHRIIVRRVLRPGRLAVLGALALAGCGGRTSVNPVDWWHGLEGGRIAQLRPPPPGATDPYPNLGQVPVRPAIPDQKTRQALAASLIAERDAADARNASDLLPNTPAASGRHPATKPASAAGAAPVATATLQAASVPDGAAPPAAAPPPAVLATPTPTPTHAAAAALGTTALSLPPLAAAPPPPPVLVGVAPEPLGAVRLGQTGTKIDIAFPAGSASLPASAVPMLQGVIARRGGKTIAITGGGADASSGQTALDLDLGLRRARAVAAVLQTGGVPESALRLGASSGGREATIRLLD